MEKVSLVIYNFWNKIVGIFNIVKKEIQIKSVNLLKREGLKKSKWTYSVEIYYYVTQIG